MSRTRHPCHRRLYGVTGSSGDDANMGPSLHTSRSNMVTCSHTIRTIRHNSGTKGHAILNDHSTMGCTIRHIHGTMASIPMSSSTMGRSVCSNTTNSLCCMERMGSNMCMVNCMIKGRGDWSDRMYNPLSMVPESSPFALPDGIYLRIWSSRPGL